LKEKLYEKRKKIDFNFFFNSRSHAILPPQATVQKR